MLCGSATAGMPGNGADARLLVGAACADGDGDGEAGTEAVVAGADADADGVVSSAGAASLSAHAASEPRPTVARMASAVRRRLIGGVGTQPTLEQAVAGTTGAAPGG